VAADVVDKAAKEPLAKAKALVQFALEKGGTDNTTAAVILLN
jgi:serine/threonine protein phosphatase PrpC